METTAEYLGSIAVNFRNSDGWQKASVNTSAHASRFSTCAMSRFRVFAAGGGFLQTSSAEGS